MPPRTPKRTSTTKAKAPAARARIEIEDLASFEESVNLLIHGDSGAGKTVLSGGAPNAVFISPEKGTVSAKRFGSKAKLIRTPTWLEFEAAVQYLEENVDEFEWAIIDSLPKMQRILLEYLLGLEAEVNEGRDIDLPQIQDHQKWQNMFMRFVNRLIDMPINIIFISTSMRVEGEDEEGDPEDIVLPAIQGKAKQGYAVANEVCAAMDSVFYIRRKRGKGGRVVRQILTERIPPFFAKDRFDTFGQAWVTLRDNDPTVMQRILDKIKDSSRNAPPKADTSLPDFDDPDLDEPDDEEDEPEPPKSRKPARKAAKPTEPDDDDEDDEEDEPEPPQRSRGSKAPAKRRAAKVEPEPEPDDDDEDEEEQAPKRPARKTSAKRPAAKKKADPEPDEDEPWDEDDEDEENF